MTGRESSASGQIVQFIIDGCNLYSFDWAYIPTNLAHYLSAKLAKEKGSNVTTDEKENRLSDKSCTMKFLFYFTLCSCNVS